MENTPVSMVNPAESLRQLAEKIQLENQLIQQLKKEVGNVIIGQSYMVDRLLIALLSDGHILLEGVPGLAKTLAIKSLAQAIKVDFSRIQFTPDLLPADITGTLIYQQKSESFHIKKGPIFSNFVLADEINRAPAKVQSALLEAMQERQITIGEETHLLPTPFLVLATQNPIEQEGTYPLPEAQVDRFMLKVNMGYPTPEEERKIIRLNLQEMGMPSCNPVLSKEDIFRFRRLVREIYMDEKVEQYIVDLVFATRQPEKYNLPELKNLLSNGCSPRASINLALASKAYAFIQGRAFVVPDDVRAIATDVMGHRLGLTYEAEAENKTVSSIIQQIIQRVEVP